MKGSLAKVGMIKDEKKKEPDQYEIDSWTRTIVEAMEILNDPKKMGHVKKAMGKKAEAVNSFESLAKKVAEG